MYHATEECDMRSFCCPELDKVQRANIPIKLNFTNESLFDRTTIFNWENYKLTMATVRSWLAKPIRENITECALALIFSRTLTTIHEYGEWGLTNGVEFFNISGIARLRLRLDTLNLTLTPEGSEYAKEMHYVILSNRLCRPSIPHMIVFTKYSDISTSSLIDSTYTQYYSGCIGGYAF